MTDKRIKEAVKNWAEKERINNPSFSLVVGDKALTIDQIVEHVDKNTELGQQLYGMIVDTAVNLFLPRQKPH